MREARNPFRLRASEQIDSDATFLRLFGPGMLDPLNLGKAAVFRVFRVLRSAPGGGKTSLLRLFTPKSLLALHSNREQDTFKDLFRRLKAAGVVDDDGPCLLGVQIACSRTFADLADIGLPGTRQMRLFFALLDARLTLAALRAAMELRRLRYPHDLTRLSVEPSPHCPTPADLTTPLGGTVLYDWARDLEESICEVLDSLSPTHARSVAGHDTLTAPLFLTSSTIKVDGKPLSEHVLYLLDDIQELATAQRRWLFDACLQQRAPAGVWVAERFETLEPDELLASGATSGRDYEAIVLEAHWRKHPTRFAKVGLDVADRRATAAANTEITSFAACLDVLPVEAKWRETYERAVEQIAKRVRELTDSRPRFQPWVRRAEELAASPAERALQWCKLEILIHRDLGRAQQHLFNDLGSEEFDAQDDSSLRVAAELFLSHRYKVPYYYGWERLTVLASYNIEQFLSVAGDQFEEISASALIGRGAILAAERQHEIVKAASEKGWQGIPYLAGASVKAFLTPVAQFCQWYTYRPSAPNDPGVNGVAISMADREKLLDPKYLRVNPDHRELLDVITTALAFNLLEPVLDYSCKGESWMLLYLNRLLCPYYDLPLGYGLFKEQKLSTLVSWMRHGFTKPKSGGLLP